MHRRQLVQILTASALAAQKSEFFTVSEAATLDRFTEIIIPADGNSPGAHDANVIRYIDLVVKYGDARQQQAWRKGLANIESEAHAQFGKSFTMLSARQQDQIVARMAKNEGNPQDDPARFFVMAKRLTLEAYHYSSIHWKKNIGRNVNISTTDFPGCTHNHPA